MVLQEYYINSDIKSFKARHKSWPEWMFESYEAFPEQGVDCSAVGRTWNVHPKGSPPWTKETAELHFKCLDKNVRLEDDWEIWDIVYFEDGEERFEYPQFAADLAMKRAEFPSYPSKMRASDYAWYGVEVEAEEECGR